ncbi:hypothetical protein NAT51_05585 [Flavobacterium amniphilum]|uniref:hypothetical protein n=1 Tax=Flavobacterium amniphilum TaxID=1834035 RepID=UPI00202ABFAD|nr:hypothetical protein [Flavobacterium amniphilum]MCL9804979.1 hypothetical protein [Flavobacterium amniphilum]
MFLKNITTEDIKYFMMLLQFVTAIIGTVYYYKYKNTVLKIFLFILWYTALNDVLGYFYQDLTNASNNYFIYNFYQILRFCIVLYIYKFYVESVSYKKLIIGFISVYCLSVVINFFVEDFLSSYFLNTFIIGATFIATAVLLYLFEVLKSDKVLYVTESLIFWISFAHLVYFVPNIPFYIVRKYYSDSSTIPYIFMINYLLLLMYYLILILGFIWSKPETKE